MGTRLYPNTKDERKLEILAGVAAGTASKLEYVQEQFRVDSHSLGLCGSSKDFDGRLERFYDWLFLPENREVRSYHHFLLHGWGKFWGGPLAEGCSGVLADVEQIQELFDMNDIYAEVDLCEGVHWS